MFDLIIQNALLFDGTGASLFEGGIAVKDGRICQVGQIHGDAGETIDAKGTVVSPGWIDVHGHTDLFAFVEPLCSAKLLQGVTTEIAGQCGYTPAPVSAKFWPVHRDYYEKLGAPIYPDNQSFHSFGHFLERLDQLPLGINLALFVGHGTLRMAAMGLSGEMPNNSQTGKMCELLEEAMKAGAMGLSTGLMYAPGSFSGFEELCALCRVTAAHDGIYTSHIRNQGEMLLESVNEVIRLAAETGVRVNISHHKAAGRKNWGKSVSSLRMIEEAGENGLTVTHDVYPYTASSTTLSATLPPSYMKMGPEKLLECLADKEFCRRLKADIMEPVEAFDNDLKESGYDGLLIIAAANTPEAVGLTIGEYARKQGVDPFEAYVNLLRFNRLAVHDICFSMQEEDMVRILSHPACMVGTDSLYIPGMKMVHPRSIGTFPRILGRYVRELGTLTLEKALYKMTGLAAQSYGLEGKGFLRPGYDADLVMFDPDRIRDGSTYQKPLCKNEGIHLVAVNGKIAVRDDTLTGTRAGRVLRRH